jgi:hypothetical protein
MRRCTVASAKPRRWNRVVYRDASAIYRTLMCSRSSPLTCQESRHTSPTCARDDDAELRTALREAIDVGRMLLVVGGSAAGKSRSTAEAIRQLPPEYRLICPRSETLPAVCEFPFAELGPAVVWLDNVQQYAHQALRDTLQRLLAADLVVIGTVRRAELDLLAPAGDVRNPAGEALTDRMLIQRVNWRVEWSTSERTRLLSASSIPLFSRRSRKEISPGAYVVAGPLLVQRLEDAHGDDERPCRYALVRTVLDWYRTGISSPIPLADATSPMPSRLHASVPPDADEINDAVKWATWPVMGVGRRTRQSLLTQDDTQALTVHDYVIDDDQRHPEHVVPDTIWQAVLDAASGEDTTHRSNDSGESGRR